MGAPTYNNARWRKVRLLVLERDEWTCQLRLPRCRGRATEADHIIDWRHGGAPFDPANLRAACKPCNVAQRNRRVAARRRPKRPQSRNW